MIDLIPEINWGLINEYIDWKLLEVVFYTVVCGIIFGLERTRRNKSIGIRTNIFVCLGAGVFAYMGTDIPGVNDNSRVIAQIVSGIGFIGAGVIFKSNSSERVVGITTASLLWVLAAIGVMIGLDKGPQALGVTVLVYLINISTHKVEQVSYKRQRIKREKKLKQNQLRLKHECYKKAVKGDKTATIRRGIRRWAPGDKVLVNSSNPREKTNILIKKIEHKKYKNIDDKLAHKEGFKKAEDLKVQLKEFYPDIKENDSMTVVYFELKS